MSPSLLSLPMDVSRSVFGVLSLTLYPLCWCLWAVISIRLAEIMDVGYETHRCALTSVSSTSSGAPPVREWTLARLSGHSRLLKNAPTTIHMGSLEVKNSSHGQKR